MKFFGNDSWRILSTDRFECIQRFIEGIKNSVGNKEWLKENILGLKEACRYLRTVYSYNDTKFFKTWKKSFKRLTTEGATLDNYVPFPP